MNARSLCPTLPAWRRHLANAVSLRNRAALRSCCELLATSPHGATEALLVRAHGFNGDMIANLVRAGLAIAQRETMKAGAKPIEVVRVRITDAGREALKESRASRVNRRTD